MNKLEKSLIKKTKKLKLLCQDESKKSLNNIQPMDPVQVSC